MASFHMASGIYKAPGVIGSEASTVSLNELLWTALFLCFCVCVCRLVFALGFAVVCLVFDVFRYIY